MWMIGLLATAEAAPVQVLAGTRNAMTTAGAVDGFRVGARYLFGPAAVEFNAFGNPNASRYDDLDALLVTLGGATGEDFQLPVTNDVFAAQVLVDMGFVPLAGETWSGGPHLYLGLELARMTHTQYLSAGIGDEPYTGLTVSSSTRRVRVGGVVTGAGLDVWWNSRVGLRFTWTSRTYQEQQVVYDPESAATGTSLNFNPTTTLDLVVQL